MGPGPGPGPNRFALPVSVGSGGTAPTKVIGPDHARFEAIDEGLELGHTRCDDAQVLDRLIAQDYRPQHESCVCGAHFPVLVHELESGSWYDTM